MNPSNHFHTLHTKEEHDKRQWLTCIQKAMLQEDNTSYQEQMAGAVDDPIPELIATESLSSSSSTNSPEHNTKHQTDITKTDHYETVV